MGVGRGFLQPLSKPTGDQELPAREGLTLDAHTDVPIRLLEEPADLTCRVAGRHVDLPRLRQGGVDAVVFALFVPPAMSIEEGGRHIRRLRELSERQLASGRWRLARSVGQLRRVVASGQIGVFFAVENGRPLLAAGVVEECSSFGVVYATLCHEASHEGCDAAGGERLHDGLAPCGVELVRRLNANGILVDVSHASDEAAAQALDVSRAPVIASHSASRALCDHPRNLPDGLALEIARHGGAVMVNAYPPLLDARACRANAERKVTMVANLAELRDRFEAPRREYYEALEVLFKQHALPAVELSVYVDHIVHFVELAGEEHVGIGTDFDGMAETPVGFEDISCLRSLPPALLERGLSERAVGLIMGENFLRVMGSAQSMARAV